MSDQTKLICQECSKKYEDNRDNQFLYKSLYIELVKVG